MLSHSSFAPPRGLHGPDASRRGLSHGNRITGLRRIAKAGVIPVEIQQKYYNKWISGSLDLFGTDHSGSAQWAYAWGIKGRVDEDKAGDGADKEHLNERARGQFHEEVSATVARVNEVKLERDEVLRFPEMSFNRKIADYGGERYSVDGRKLTRKEWVPMLPRCCRPLPTKRD